MALRRFISQAIDRCLPFFQQLKGHKKGEWTSDCEQAFQQLKQYLSSPPLLSKPEEGEPLFLYLVVSASAVSSALIR
ncbi:RNase H-like domain-containing protein, partial [Mycobacterium kansasii]